MPSSADQAHVPFFPIASFIPNPPTIDSSNRLCLAGEVRVYRSLHRRNARLPSAKEIRKFVIRQIDIPSGLEIAAEGSDCMPTSHVRGQERLLLEKTIESARS
jgi:hypothetical protein